MKEIVGVIGTLLGGLLSIAVVMWVVIALFGGRPNGTYYINQDCRGNAQVKEDVRYGKDRTYYEGDEDRAFIYWKELRSITEQPYQQPNSGDIIRP